MSRCPARDSIKKRFLFFAWWVRLPHEFDYFLFWDGSWEIRWTCEHCNATYSEGMINDFELMEKLQLKKVPFKRFISSEEDLVADGCFGGPIIERSEKSVNPFEE